VKTLVLVPDGVGVRNFVLGPFVLQLAATGSVHVLHGVPAELLPNYRAAADGDVQWHALHPYTETPLSATLRYSLSYAQMNWVATRSMQFNASRPIEGSWRTRLMHKGARLVGRAASFPTAIGLLERGHCAAVSKAPAVAYYRRLFEHIQPDVLFCTHQRPPIILPAVLAARRLGIPTGTFIFSWDNLSSKGRIAAPFDHYFVWSRVMRDELLQYYPDVDAAQVHIVGTPQFDAYGDERLLMSRATFLKWIGADPGRPLICYSGGDTGNCPEDHHHVRILLDLIRSGQIDRRPQVVLRPSPADEGSRYDAVRRAYPELIYKPPMWAHTQRDSWAHVFPLKGDAVLLANLTTHADLNVNFGSTMTLDFALHDRPVVTPAFNVTEPSVFNMPLLDFCLQFEHYRPVADLGAARFATSPAELAAFVNAYLADPMLDREGRRRLVAMHVDEPPGTSSQRVVAELTRIGGNRAHVVADPAPRPALRTS
jgi:hypothetical protein